MLIVGGKYSSNTKELESVLETHCKNTYLIQNLEDLKDIKISSNISISSNIKIII